MQRNRILGGACASWIIVCLLGAVGGAEQPAGSAAPTPFFVLRNQPAEYAGPGREESSPNDVTEVLLGYFGPSDPQHAPGGDMWRAACLAVDQANAHGGYRGKPFRLVSAWSENPWGTGVSKVVRLVYDDRVWAIVGGIDGPSTHLAEQVVAKARLPLVSPAAGDKTANLANVPWLFSLLPGDHLQVPPLVQYIAEHGEGKRLVVLSAAEHDWELFTRELLVQMRQRRLAPQSHFRFRPGLSPAPSRTEKLVAAALQGNPHLLVLVAGAEDSAVLLRQLRQSGYGGPVIAGPAVAQNRFLEHAGEVAERVIFPLLWQPGKQGHKFAEQFAERFGHRPDYLAAHTFDAVTMLIAAVHKAGLNRARIGDALRALSPWEGATGRVAWDPLGANTRQVHLGTIRHGKPVVLSATGSGHGDAHHGDDRRPEMAERGASETPSPAGRSLVMPFPSVMVIHRSAGTSSITSSAPPSQRISIRSTRSHSPSPKYNREPKWLW